MVILPLLVLALIAGCESDGDDAGEMRRAAREETASVFRTGSGDTEQIDRPVVRSIELVFDVVRADLPVQTIRHSEKLWNHVDELRPQGVSLGDLARNGLRVGVASASSWPAFRAILASATDDIRRNEFVAQRGAPFVLSLGHLTEPETIFSYGKSGSLSGKTFSAGERLLVLDYALQPELSGAVELRTMLTVRHDRGVLTWERQGGVIRQTPEYDEHVFDGILPITEVGPGEMLVVGPNAASENEYLVGSRFLSTTKNGVVYETVFFITPEPFAAVID